ncbi:MAG: ribonuclease PH [Gemmatales bacterium]
MQRHDGRATDQLRPLTLETNAPGYAAGRVLAQLGNTIVLCTCSIEPAVPEFLVGQGKGWLTAEYSMLPGSTMGRKSRDRSGKVDGRSVEIQRLIGRSLRAVTNLEALGERTLWVDCDVLQADGGTRVTAISGAWVAVYQALTRTAGKYSIDPERVLPESVAAVSVGLLNDNVILDLNYLEDRDADVDLNLVMTGNGKLVEVQAGGEEATFIPEQLQEMLRLGQQGIEAITELQLQVARS